MTAQAPAGSRIVSVEIQTPSGYTPINAATSYKVATVDFVSNGGDGYTILKQASGTFSTGIQDCDALQDYIKANSPIAPAIQGRIKIKY